MPNPEISVTLPIEQWNLTMQLLASHPFNQVAELMNAIQRQAQGQIQQMQAAQRPNGDARMVPAS